MSLRAADFALLSALRERFLHPHAGGNPYWRTPEEIALYDQTFGERIGWKWDAVLHELHLRGWQPPSRSLVDWGCGSGVAGRRMLQRWPGVFTELKLHDRSRLAVEFARATASREFPSLAVEATCSGGIPAGSTVVISHVLNELSDAQLAALVRELRPQAAAVIWVESATHANSRRFIQHVREPLRTPGLLGVVAPCTHANVCGLLTPENERHWCHSFAAPPSSIFQDRDWMEFSRTMKIDLRSIPYSFLAMQRETAPAPAGRTARVIGRPRDYKGYSKILSCEASGVHDRVLQKRDAPSLLKDVQRGHVAPIYDWQLTAEKITGGTPAIPEPRTGPSWR